MRIRLVCTGTLPLLMHNVRLASPRDPFARKLKELNSKVKKTEEDLLEIARVEFYGGMYHDAEFGPYIPPFNLLRCITSGARASRGGKKVERGVAIAAPILPLLYEGPRDLEKLWLDDAHVDIRSAAVQRSRVDRCRPIFRDWAIEADLVLDPGIITLEEFKSFAEAAGKFEGLGDFRAQFGRFDTEVTVLAEDD